MTRSRTADPGHLPRGVSRSRTMSSARLSVRRPRNTGVPHFRRFKMSSPSQRFSAILGRISAGPIATTTSWDIAQTRSTFDNLHETLCILWRRRLLIIVEIDEHVALLKCPLCGCIRPPFESSCRITAMISAAGPMPAHVYVKGRDLPGGRSVTVVGEAKGRSMFMEHKRISSLYQLLCRNSKE